MRIERRRSSPSLSRGPPPLRSVGRLRSGISFPVRIISHHHHRPPSKSSDDYYSLAYRRPLLLPDDGDDAWGSDRRLLEGSPRENLFDDDGTDISPSSGEWRYVWKAAPRAPLRAPRAPTTPVMSAAAGPVRRALSAVTSLPSLRVIGGGNQAYDPRDGPRYHSDYYDDNSLECRDDDDHRHLLQSKKGVNKATGHQQFWGSIIHGTTAPLGGQVEQRAGDLGGMKTFKQLQLHEDAQPRMLRVVDFGGFGDGGSFSDIGGGLSSDFGNWKRSSDSSSLCPEDTGSSSSEKENQETGYAQKIIPSKSGSKGDDAVAETREGLRRRSSASSTALRISQKSSILTSDAGRAASKCGNGDIPVRMIGKGESLARMDFAILANSNEFLARTNESGYAGSDGCDGVLPVRINSNGGSLVGLKIGQDNARLDSDDGDLPARMDSNGDSLVGLDFAGSINYAGSAFSYSVDGNSIANKNCFNNHDDKDEKDDEKEDHKDDDKDNDKDVDDNDDGNSGDDEKSLKSLGSSSTIDLDGHLTPDGKTSQVPPATLADRSPMTQSRRIETPLDYARKQGNADLPSSSYQMLVDSSVTAEGQQSYLTYAAHMSRRPSPVAVTPTENGDVILLTPVDDVMDAGPQPMQSTPMMAHMVESPRTQLDDAMGAGPRPARSTTLSAWEIESPVTNSLLMDATEDIGVQPKALGWGADPRIRPTRLLIPSLHEGNTQDTRRERLEPALKNSSPAQQVMGRLGASRIKSVMCKKVMFWESGTRTNDEASPTGVNELSGVTTLMLPSKPPLALTAPAKEGSDFIASSDWNEEGEGDGGSVAGASFSSQPFGPYTVHEDVLRELRKERSADDRGHVIERCPSLESDCGQFGSVVSSMVAGPTSVFTGAVSENMPVRQEEHKQKLLSFLQHQHMPNKKDGPSGRSLLDMAVDEDQSKGSKESRETCASLGSFNQIFTRGSLPGDEEDSDSESDAPGDYFDFSHIESFTEPGTSWASKEDLIIESPASAGSLCGGETPDFLNKIVKQESLLKTAAEGGQGLVQDHGLAVEVLACDSSTSSSETPDFMKDIARKKFMLKNSRRPWAKTYDENDSVSDYAGSDLISMPSASFSSSSNSSQEEDASPPIPHVLSSDFELDNAIATAGSTSEGESKSGPRNMDNFDTLNKFWVHEWKAMAAAEGATQANAVESKDLNDSDSHQPQLRLKENISHLMRNGDELEKSPCATETTGADDNICSDCDGNEYLKIFDLDNGTDIYDVLQGSYKLQTVEECSSEEEKEGNDASLEKKAEGPMMKGVSDVGAELKGLGELWSKIDEYQATLNHGTTRVQLPPFPTGLLDFRTVKSTKKQFVHTRKRAIVKAKNASEKAKYGLTDLEKGSHYDKVGHGGSLCANGNKISHEACKMLTQPSSIKNTSIDGVLPKTTDALHKREAGAYREVGKDDLALLRMKIEAFAVPEDSSSKSNVLTCSKKRPKAEGDDHSLLSSSLSVEDSLDIWELYECQEESTNEGGTESEQYAKKEYKDSAPGQKEEGTDSGQPDNNRTKDNASVQPSSCHPQLSRGTSQMLIKLYDENVELAETLAATQSELEKVSRKLEQMTVERDEIIATARFEI